MLANITIPNIIIISKNPMPITFYAVIFLLIILLQMTTDFYVPSMPHISQFFHASNSVIQMTFSCFILGMSLSHLLFAPISDKLGRKKPILCGIIISIIGSLFCLNAPTVSYFIFGRFVQGLGIGCCNSVGRSLVRDKFHGDKLAKIGSVVGMLSILIMIISPILGGYIVQYYGWKMNFFIIAVMGIIVVGMTYQFLPETNQHLNNKAMQTSFVSRRVYRLITNPVFIRYTLCSCLAAGGLIAWFTISSFILKDLFHLNPIAIGMQNLYIASAVFCSGVINLVLIRYMGIQAMVKVGTLLMMASGMLLLGIVLGDKTKLTYVMLSIALFATGAGLVFINAFAGAFEPVAAIAGIAGMTYALLQDGFASIISRLIAQEGFNNLLCLAILLIIAGLSSLILVFSLKQQNMGEIL